MTRYILEGTWTGYTAEQRRVMHVETIKENHRKLIEHLRSIQFTDGTMLLLEIKPRGNHAVHEKNSYGSLIREAAAVGTPHVRVADLQRRKQA